MPLSLTPAQFECPPADSPVSARLAWLDQAQSEGLQYLQAQRAYSDLDRAFDIIAGEAARRLPSKYSQVYVNRLKRQAREVIATLANIRIQNDFRTDNPRLYESAHHLNKLHQAWYLGLAIDRRWREALQWAAVGGTGWISPRWDPEYWERGAFKRGDIVLDVLGPRDVLLVQAPPSGSPQDAYAGIIQKSVPLATARALWRDYADQIEPDGSSPSLLKKGIRRIQRFLSPALNAAQSDKERNAVSLPFVRVSYIYVNDRTINTSGHTIAMGDPGTSWAYSVPSLGSDIPSGIFDPQGRPLLRKADPDDCLLYPNRRLLIRVGETSPILVSDGPSPWFHGRFPAVKVTVDDWPWEALGFSLIRDGIPLQDAHTDLLRGMVQMAKAKLRPPMAYDNKSISKKVMDAFDPCAEGQAIPFDGMSGIERPIRPILDAPFYDMPGYAQQLPEYLDKSMDYLMASGDATALFKAKQVPAADTVEKLLEASGPVIMDISRSMETPMRELAEMWKGLAFQFYTTSRKLQILGENSFTPEDYDYDPGNLIPSHMPWENTSPIKDPATGQFISGPAPSAYSISARARHYMSAFFFQVTPNTMHSSAQTTQKLLYLQLKKAGFPLDSWTLAEKFAIPNFGPPPPQCKNIMERYWEEKRLELAHQVELAKAMQAAGLGPPPGGAGRGGEGQGKGGGRPHTNSTAPHVKQKDGGTRSSIVTS